MKKITILIIISTILISCTWEKTENTEKQYNNEITETNTIMESNTWEIIKEVKKEENNTWEIIESTTIIENNTWEVIKINDMKNEITETQLESEVNDLLDEFIDSLDKYDK
jgi:hypothetical protein